MILNLTQHMATTEQEEQGLVNVQDIDKLREILTVNEEVLVSEEATIRYIIDAKVTELINTFVFPLLVERATEVCGSSANRIGGAFELSVLVGGMPTLVDALVKRLKEFGCVPMYALSGRVSSAFINEDGSVSKITVFKHIKFLKV